MKDQPSIVIATQMKKEKVWIDPDTGKEITNPVGRKLPGILKPRPTEEVTQDEE